MSDPNGIDPQIPKSILQRIREEQPNSETWSEDLRILLDPSVQCKSLVLPMTDIVKTRNHDYRYHWTYLKRGSYPDTRRYMELKAKGFTNATAYNPEQNPTGDVEVLVADIGSNFTEIFDGDRILMKAPRHIYNAYIKQHQMDSIRQTTRARTGQYEAGMRGNPFGDMTMKTADFGGVPTSYTDFAGNRAGAVDVEQVMQHATPANTVVVKQPREQRSK